MISVIIVTKNSERHLKQCLDSILMQEYKPLEIIVVDANSSDNTIKIIVKANLEAEYERNIQFNVVEVPSNTTIGEARNVGYKNASGEILAYIDSDVELPHKYWLENMYKPFVVTKHNPICGLQECKIAGVQTLAKCRDTDPEILKKIHSSFEYKNTIIDKDHYEMIGTSHLLIRKNLVEEFGGFIDVSMGEDTELTNKIIQKGYSFVYLPDEKCYHYHVDNYWDYLKKSYRNYKHGLKLILGRFK